MMLYTSGLVRYSLRRPVGSAFSSKAGVHSYGDVALMMTALSENVQRD